MGGAALTLRTGSLFLLGPTACRSGSARKPESAPTPWNGTCAGRTGRKNQLKSLDVCLTDQ